MKTLYLVALILLLFNGVSAVFGGLSLILDPTGRDLQLDLSLLAHSPFNDFLLPGILLFCLNGLFSLVALLWAWLRWKHFAGMITIEGVFLSGWIIVQILMIRQFSSLQVVYGGIGLALLWLGWKLKQNSQTEL